MNMINRYNLLFGSDNYAYLDNYVYKKAIHTEQELYYLKYCTWIKD